MLVAPPLHWTTQGSTVSLWRLYMASVHDHRHSHTPQLWQAWGWRNGFGIAVTSFGQKGISSVEPFGLPQAVPLSHPCCIYSPRGCPPCWGYQVVFKIVLHDRIIEWASVLQIKARGATMNNFVLVLLLKMVEPVFSGCVPGDIFDKEWDRPLAEGLCYHPKKIDPFNDNKLLMMKIPHEHNVVYNGLESVQWDFDTPRIDLATQGPRVHATQCAAK